MANKDIFNTNIRPTEAWSLDGAVVTISDGTELLVSQVNINYQRPITPVKPINQNKNIMIAGEGSGTVSLSIIVGPGDKLKGFLTQYSDPCSVSKNTMKITAAVKDECHTSDGNTVFLCGDLLSNAVGVSVASSGPGGIAMINGTISFVMNSLTIQ